MAKRLGVRKEDRDLLKQVLMKMVKDGTIFKTKGGRYSLPEAQEDKVGKKSNIVYTKELKGKTILGNFVRTGKTGMVVPRDFNIPPLIISSREVKGIRNGSLVVAEIKGRKGRDRRLIGTVVEVLGKSGVIEVEKKGLFVEYGLPQGFPKEVISESEKISDVIPKKELERRVDLRGKTIFTIDNDSARDFDDAVGIERRGRGYRLVVSIADVSHYVAPGSSLDNEALERATSIYLPDTVVPMLPEKVSNWVCSLVPDKDRLTKTVEMDFDEDGTMVDARIYNSVIRSKARLTYTLVSDLLEHRSKLLELDEDVRQSLFVMKELYHKLKARRIENGELDFDFPEPELIQDELGRTIDVVKSTRNIAHGIIEEFMIEANSAVANYVFSSGVPSIYRVHQPPDIGAIKELAEALKKLGFSLKVVGDKVRAQDLQKILSESAGSRHQLAVHTLVLQSLKRAVYSTLPLGHFGLALDHYAHFTSPIRRYPDLVVHRIVDSLIKGRPIPYDEETLEWIASNSSARERYAAEVEREAIEIERVYMMKSHIGSEFDGFVTSVMPFGLFVELNKFFVEGLVPRKKINYPKDKKFDIGESVKVRLIAADLTKRKMTFELVK